MENKPGFVAAGVCSQFTDLARQELSAISGKQRREVAEHFMAILASEDTMPWHGIAFAAYLITPVNGEVPKESSPGEFAAKCHLLDDSLKGSGKERLLALKDKVIEGDFVYSAVMYSTLMEGLTHAFSMFPSPEKLANAMVATLRDELIQKRVQRN